ncbi:oligosaccharide flippase family protein [Ruminococcus sp.]|uniref:lipopolysaccharide biosynthesis protein n=1 Tax=Ruminococcus sp. TaxID=41978 RepID=UPI001B6212BE|nr:oligosaccharide flippase family protein [Ruminococcus sp.]MBP5433108.1 oligosaccharide flippase family protein [Ruminococcus sp.]
MSSSKGKYQSLALNTIIFAIGNIGSKIILFLLVPLYTKCMSPDEYGTADLVFTIGQILVPFLSAGIFSAVIRFGISKETRHQDVLRNALLIISAGSLIMLLITPLAGLYGAIANWKWYLCAFVITDLFSAVEMNYLKAKEQNKLYTAISLIRTLALALCNVLFLAVLKAGIPGYLLSTILSALLTMVLVAVRGDIFRDIKDSKRNDALMKEMLVYAAPLILNGISWWVIHSSDKTMIEYMVSAAALGIYSVAGRIPSLINVIVSIFSQAWDISSIKEVEDGKDTKFFDNIYSVYSFMVFLITIAAIAVIKPFMHIYVAEEFRTAWMYVPLLLVSAAYGAVGSYFGSFYGALKKSRLSMWSTLLGAVINIGLNLVLIPVMGIWGAVIGTVVAYAAIAVFRTFSVLRYVRININIPRYFINLVIVAVQAVFVSVDFCGIFASAVAAVLFIALNYRSAKEFSAKGMSILKSRLRKKGK